MRASEAAPRRPYAAEVAHDDARPREPRRFGAAIFDLDGLLVDSEPLWHEAEVSVFRALGVPLTVADVVTTKGRFVGEVTEYWYRRFPWTGPAPAQVARDIVDAVAELFDQRLALRPGAAGAVDRCERRGLRLGLASSSPMRLIEAALRRVGLRERFEVVHSAEHEPAGKPDPGIFLTTAARLSTPPTRCVVLEDSVAGVEAAVAAGMACIAVPEASGHGAAPSAGGGFGAAHLVLDSLVSLDDGAWDLLQARWSATPGPAGRGRPGPAVSLAATGQPDGPRIV